MRKSAVWLAAALVAFAWMRSAVGGAASEAEGPAVIRIEAELDRPISLTLADLARMERSTVDAKDHDGKLARFEGVLLTNLLGAAGSPSGSALRGLQLSRFLLVEAADGYRVVFSLAELDPDFTDASILVADHRDGQLLGSAEGPLRLVAPKDKRPARWVRQVTALRVLRAQP